MPRTRTVPLDRDTTPLALPHLRALLVGPALRARHPHAHAREIAPGLHELVATFHPRHGLEVSPYEHLQSHGLTDAELFAHARLGTCSEPLTFGRAGPLPGVHAHVLGGPGEPDTAVALFELADSLTDVLGPAGLVFAVPSHGMALFAAPYARGLCRALVRFGRQRQFWTSNAAVGRELAGEPHAQVALQFLVRWTASCHAHFAEPVSSSLYWYRTGREIEVLVEDTDRPGDIAAVSSRLAHA